MSPLTHSNCHCSVVFIELYLHGPEESLIVVRSREDQTDDLYTSSSQRSERKEREAENSLRANINLLFYYFILPCH